MKLGRVHSIDYGIEGYGQDDSTKKFDQDWSGYFQRTIWGGNLYGVLKETLLPDFTPEFTQRLEKKWVNFKLTELLTGLYSQLAGNHLFFQTLRYTILWHKLFNLAFAR